VTVGVAPAPRVATIQQGLPLRFPLVLLGIVAISCLLLLVVTLNPIVACAPIVLVGIGMLFLRLPIRVPLLTLITLVAFSDIVPQALPPGVDGRYDGPVHPLYSLLFDNLNNVTGIAALRFSATEVVYVVVLLIFGARLLAGIRLDRVGRTPAANALMLLLAQAFVAVVSMEIWGLARGGDFTQSLWQFRTLFWMPVITALLCMTLRDARDYLVAMRWLTVAACLKIVFGIQYLATVAWPNGFQAPMMTSHNDSLLFVVVLMGFVCRWVHAPSWRRFWQGTVFGGWLLVGIVLNNRRIAFVSLLGCLFMLYLLLRGPLKRSANRLIVRSIPLAILYLAIGSQHPTGVFKPAGLVMSVTQQKDESSLTRDIENTNLLHTLKQVGPMGAGWGHEYIELVQAYDISKFFAQYKFIAHNSVLWLWSIGGLFGFTFIWLPLSAAIFLARRSYFFARTPDEQTSAVLILTTVIVYMVQAWGDMGTQGLSCMLIAALAVAASAKLAVETGAFPAQIPLLAAPRRRMTAIATLPSDALVAPERW
jgi:hypothetical protein